MNNIIAHEINSDKFEYISATETFVAEASELPETFNFTGLVWNDAVDVGFVMISQRTSDKLIFTLKDTDKDADGDTEGWNYIADPAVNNNLIASPIKLLIIND